MALLTVNSGSSSLKLSLFDVQNLQIPRATLAIEDITVSDETVTHAIDQIRLWLTDSLHVHQDDIEAVGYRVVHGGDRYSSAAYINEEMLRYFEQITELAPNHMPEAIIVINSFLEAYPKANHVACFDTGLFHEIPDVAKILSIPMSLQKELKIRRYGFHGLSYESLLASFKENEGSIARNGRIIMAHLGSGASVAAFRDGKPVDMSMGFTPASGIMMSTRSGDLDPSVLTFLQTMQKMNADELDDLIDNKSGLLGVSEISGDMKTLLDEQQNDPRAKLAIDLFCYQIKKAIGAYAASLGGVDSIIFSGGIGERSAEIRLRICDGLQFLGVHIDEDRNSQSERLISSEASSVGVHVIPTREDWTVASQTVGLIKTSEDSK